MSLSVIEAAERELRQVHAAYTEEISKMADEYLALHAKLSQEKEVGDMHRRAMVHAKGVNDRLKALIARTVESGLLCDPGCCGDDCVCDELREVAKGE